MRGCARSWPGSAAWSSTRPGTGFSPGSTARPAAIRCALAIRDAVREIGLEVRLGLHAGECEVLDGKVAGIAVAIGARVSARAAAGEVLVSQTVKDLVAGSGIAFDDRGLAELKGVPGRVAAVLRHIPLAPAANNVPQVLVSGPPPPGRAL